MRLNFNFGGNYAPAMKFPKQVFLKELSLRSSHAKHASKVTLLCLVLYHSTVCDVYFCVVSVLFSLTSTLHINMLQCLLLYNSHVSKY